MVTDAISEAQAVALRFVGLRADDVYGARLGRVEAILVDRENGTVQWIHVRLTGLGGGYLALPLKDLTAGAGHLHFPYDRARLLSAPRSSDTGALTSRQERQLCEYFDISAKTRGAAVSAWERRATSARLVRPGVWEPAPRGTGAGIPTGAQSFTARDAVRAPAPRPQSFGGALAPRRLS